MLKLPGSSTLGLHNQARALALLTYTVLAVAVLGGLYWAQSVVIPLALGILFTTIAAPVVKLIERVGLTRIPAVIAVTVVMAAIGAGLGWLIFAQTSQLVVDLPDYQENIVAKIDAVKELTRSPSRENWDRMMKKLQQTIDEEALPDDAPPAPPEPVLEADEREQPSSSGGDPIWLPAATVIFGLMAEVTGYIALALVVAIFLLVDREDMRNRLIQLTGRGQITQTTKALDDAARRISRFLIVQLCINVAYGILLAIGLYFLGVKYALLWGVLAAVLRYVPYVGGSIAVAFPVTLALAQFPSWWQASIIVGLVLVMEIIINNFVEPRLYGQSIGVSSVALIVAATFWTFLWGPVGLIMAGPLTVCLVVLGKYVPPLRFLDVLLGDQSPMERDVVLYQRLLAKDEIETERILEEELEQHTAIELYDSLIFPVGANAGLDRENGLLSSEDEQYVLDMLDEIMLTSVDPLATSPPPGENVTPVRLLLAPARDRGDRLGVTALMSTLHPTKYQLVQANERMIGADIIALAEEQQVDGICISSLPPGGLSHTKYLCKRIRSRHPKLKIFVGHWSNDAAHARGWSSLDADVVVHSLAEMLKQLEAWKPVLEATGAKASEDEPGQSPIKKPHFVQATKA